MKDDSVKILIRTFFQSKLSNDSQLYFRWWFRLKNHQKEKEEAMLTLWENSPSVASQETWEDFTELQSRIHKETPFWLNPSLLKRMTKYAAILILVIFSSILTYHLTKKTPVHFDEFNVPYGQCQKLSLADGSVVWINAGSTLIYPQKFSEDTRTVYLNGEADFYVAKNPKQPFIVETKHLSVRALGTKFSVQAYPDSHYTKATLEQGSIRVNTGVNFKSAYILKPNEQLTLIHKTNQVSIDVVDAEKLASWKAGYMVFQGATFEEIADALGKKYNVRINYDTEKYKGQTFYVKFNPNESLEQVLSVLCLVINKSTYKITPSTIYFYTK